MKKTLSILGIVAALFINNANAQVLTAMTSNTINQSSIVSNNEAQIKLLPVSGHAAWAGNADEPTKYNVPRVYLGVRILGTISTFKVNTVENNNITVAQTSAMLGYGGGFYLGVNLSRNFAIQPEILYSTLSQKYIDKGLDRRIDISYVNVPLMLVLNTDIRRIVNFNVTAGPQLGINTGAKVSSVSQGNTQVVNTKFAVKATDFGVAYGAGFDFRFVPALSVGIGFRGVTGLVDISDKNSTATYSSTDNNGVTTSQTVVVLDKSKVTSYGGYLGIRLNF